jgi:hypothetical protein
MKKYFNIAADCKPQLHNMVGFLEAEKNTLFETIVVWAGIHPRPELCRKSWTKV